MNTIHYLSQINKAYLIKEDIDNLEKDFQFVYAAPYQGFLEDIFKEKMELINYCIDCGHCKNHCPYKLDTPSLLKKELKNYN
ncbi:MAG TPA: 4Fe-4S dicluster domain-containing protein [Candidatus Paceibacterota bacterium]